MEDIVDKTLININNMKEQNLNINNMKKQNLNNLHNRQLKTSGAVGNSIPTPPPSRILREGVTHFCTICGSTSSKVGIFGLFGERLCDNQKCPNSKSKKR